MPLQQPISLFVTHDISNLIRLAIPPDKNYNVAAIDHILLFFVNAV